MSVILGSVSVMAGIVLLVRSLAGTHAVAKSQRLPTKRSQKRVMIAGLTSGSMDVRIAMLERPMTERVVRPGVAALARRARQLTPAELVKSLERRIALAGVGATWPIERVLAAKLTLGGGGLLLGLLNLATKPSGGALLIALLLVSVGYFVPDFALYHFSIKRQEEIQDELADTLDQITVTVEAGLGFEASMDRAARSGGGPLKRELSRTLRDIQLGVPRAQALENLLQRTDVRDLKNFVHAVLQSERYGIPIAQILRVQSAELRTKRRQRAEERAMKVPVKIVLPLMLCILPTLFIVLLGPAVIRISNSGFGG